MSDLHVQCTCRMHKTEEVYYMYYTVESSLIHHVIINNCYTSFKFWSWEFCKHTIIMYMYLITWNFCDVLINFVTLTLISWFCRKFKYFIQNLVISSLEAFYQNILLVYRGICLNKTIKSAQPTIWTTLIQFQNHEIQLNHDLIWNLTKVATDTFVYVRDY